MGHLANPAWWTSRHESSWDRVREAMRRDWEQTKHDVGVGGRDLDQDVGETLEQAAGKQPIPPRDVPTPEDTTRGAASVRGRWDDVEGPLGYGYGARLTYGQKYPVWNEDLERNLERDWRATERGMSAPWQRVKDVVRRGYEYVVGKS